MKKFLKRVFWLIIFPLSVLLGFCVYHGLRPDNYREFIQEIPDKMSTVYAEWQDSRHRNVEEESSVSTDAEPLSQEKPPSPAPTEKSSSPANPFRDIDRHARKAPSSVEQDIPQLAAYLAEPAANDLEKARAIFVWIAEHISYDDAGYNSGSYGDCSAEAVLESRTSVCEGFSNVFLALGQEMGLDIVKISGYSKGYSYRAGDRLEEPNHAWNAIQIDGKWRIFDATWGQGNGTTVNGKLKSVKDFDPYWFNVDPYQAIFNHYPENPQQTFINTPVSLREYEKLPYARASFFKLGFDGKSLLKHTLHRDDFPLPQTYSFDFYAQIKKGPVTGVLQPGKTYHFELYVPRAQKIAIVDDENTFTHFEKNGKTFSLDFIPEGESSIHISIQMPGQKAYTTVLEYQIQERIS